MLDSSNLSLQTRRADFPAITQSDRPAKLIADAADTLKYDRASAIILLRQAVALLQSGGGTKTAVEALAPHRPALAPWQVKRVNDYIHAHLDGPIALRELAGVARLSCSHFSRAFKGAFGQSPHAFIMCERVELARQKMMDSHAPLSQIALSCGFADQAHLTRLFRRKVGFAPHQWRRANQSAPQ